MEVGETLRARPGFDNRLHRPRAAGSRGERIGDGARFPRLPPRAREAVTHPEHPLRLRYRPRR